MNTLSISFAGHDQSCRFNDHHRADGPWKRRSHPGNHLQKNENEQVSQTFTILPFDNFTILPLYHFTNQSLNLFTDYLLYIVTKCQRKYKKFYVMYLFKDVFNGNLLQEKKLFFIFSP